LGGATHEFELVLGGGDADVEAVDFSGPAFVVGFGEAVEEVRVDLFEARELVGVGS